MFQKDLEIKMLWTLYAEKDRFFEGTSFRLLTPFLNGFGRAMVSVLGYHCAWRGPFHAFVCEKLKVFNWDNVEKALEGVPRKSKEYKALLEAAEEKEAKNKIFIVTNWLDAIENRRTDGEAFDFFFDLLRDYDPSLCYQILKTPIKEEYPNQDLDDLSELLLQYKDKLPLLIGKNDFLQLKQYINGFIRGTMMKEDSAHKCIESFLHINMETEKSAYLWSRNYENMASEKSIQLLFEKLQEL